MSLPPILFVTGTDTGVGKTVTTAALASTLSAAGRTVAVYKPTQAGLEDGFGDIDVVSRLAGVRSVHEGIRLCYPMAPVAAAAREGVALPGAEEHVQKIASLAASHDVTLVEGAGGLLVQLDNDGRTLADLAAQGPSRARDASATPNASVPTGTPVPENAFVVVCRAALGTLNHTALTLEALRRRSLPVAGVVIGSWPDQPDEIDVSNRAALEQMAPLLGTIPAGAGALTPDAFQADVAGRLTLP